MHTFTNKSGYEQYPHPYQTEIENYAFPAKVYTKAEPIQPQPLDTTTAIMVDTPEAVATMLEELKNATEIAIDLEHHDTRSYIGIVSLMQITTREKDWIVDTLRPWRRKLECLNEVFTDPSIVKVKLFVCPCSMMRLQTNVTFRFCMVLTWMPFGFKEIWDCTLLVYLTPTGHRELWGIQATVSHSFLKSL